jgi:hypothetical protein
LYVVPNALPLIRSYSDVSFEEQETSKNENRKRMLIRAMKIVLILTGIDKLYDRFELGNFYNSMPNKVKYLIVLLFI